MKKLHSSGLFPLNSTPLGWKLNLHWLQKAGLTFLLLLSFIIGVRGEGTSTWGTASDRRSWIWLPDFDRGNTGYDVRGFMMMPTRRNDTATVYNANYNPAHRFYVYLKAGETVFYGIRRGTGTGGTLTGHIGLAWYYDPSNTGYFPDGKVRGTSLVLRDSVSLFPGASTGFNRSNDTIGRPVDADSTLWGPKQITGKGYTGFSFVNNTGVDRAFWLEIYGNDAIEIVNFDVTVASGSLGSYVEHTGRAYCKYWSIVNGLPSGTPGVFNNTSFHDNFGFYVAVDNTLTPANDYYIKYANFAKANAGYTVFYANETGPGNTGTYLDKRKSRTGVSLTGAQYALFFSDPDVTVWPSAANPTANSSVYFSKRTTPTVGGFAVFSVTHNNPGTVDILVDIDNSGGFSTGDVIRSKYFASPSGAEPDTIQWDGTNNSGGNVASGTIIQLSTSVSFYPVHFPIYDMEQSLGIDISNVRPLSGVPNVLYWDDSPIPRTNLPSPNTGVRSPRSDTVNITGSTSPGHIWWAANDEGFSQNNTINTWAGSSAIVIRDTYRFYWVASNIAVSKTANKDTAEAGESVTFRIIATNTGVVGINHAGAMTVKDLLPSGFSYMSHSVSHGTYIPGTGIWSIDTMNVLASDTLYVTAKMLASGSYLNTAFVTYASDPVRNNDTARYTIVKRAPSVIKSLITASPKSITANGISTSTVTVKLKDQNNVDLTFSGGTVVMFTDAGTIGPVTDHEDGTYTATLTSSTVVDTASLSYTLNSDPGTNKDTVIFVPGPATASVLSASPHSIIANGTSTSTVTVRLKDFYGNFLTSSDGTVVMFTDAGTIGSVTDHGNGTYTAILTSSTVVDTASLSYTWKSNPGTNTDTVYFTPGPATASVLSASPHSIIANGTSTSTVTVRLKDAFGNFVTSSDGTVVMFTDAGTIGSVTDHGNGTYTAILTSSTVVDTASLSYTWKSNPGTNTDTVYFTPGPATASVLSASPHSIIANGTSTSTVTVRLKDAFGNFVTSSDGTVVMFTDAGTIGSVTDHGNGTYTAILTSSTVVDTASLSYTWKSNPGTNTDTVYFTPGPATASVLSASPHSIIANGTSTSTVTVRLKDAFGNFVTSSDGTVVMFTDAGTIGSVTDHGNGTYTAILTSSTVVDTASLSYTWKSNPGTNTDTVYFTPGPATASVLSASPHSIIANGTSTSTVTVRLKDAFGNFVTSSDGTVVMFTDAGTIGSVTDHGNGTYTAILTSSTVVDTASLSYTWKSNPGTNTDTVYFTPGPATASVLSASPHSIIANGTSTSTVTVRLKDAFGNFVTSSDGTVVMFTDAGTIGSVTDHGNGTYTAILTSSTVVDTASLSYTWKSNPGTNTDTVIFTPGPADPITSKITADPIVIDADGLSTSTITVRLKDANGNYLTTGGDIVTIITDAGTIGSTTDNEDGTYTAILTSSITPDTAGLSYTLNGPLADDTATVYFIPTVSLITSQITANPIVIIATGTTTSTITVQLKNSLGVNLTSSGGTVVISTSAGTIGSTTDNGDGTYTAILTSTNYPDIAGLSYTLNSVLADDTATVHFIDCRPDIILDPADVSICPNTNTKFFIKATAPSAMSYQWQVSTGGAYANVVNTGIYTGATTDTLKLTSASSGYQGFKYRCIVTAISGYCKDTSNIATLSMTLNVASVTITGDDTLCAGAAVANFTAVPVNGGTNPTYQWKVHGVNKGTNSPYFAYTSPVNQKVISCMMTSNASCISTASVMSNSILMTVIPVPAKPGTILQASGKAKLCPGDTATYSINPALNADYYTWVPPVGGDIISGQGTTLVTVVFNSSFTANTNIGVASYNSCGVSALQSKIINRDAIPVVTSIIGPNQLPCKAVGIEYHVNDLAGGTFAWRFDNVTGIISAVVSSGQGTNSILAEFFPGFLATSAYVTVQTGCGISSEKKLVINYQPPSPGLITGPNVVCPNQSNVTYSVPQNPTVDFRTWWAPNGSTISDGVNSVVAPLTLATPSTSVTINFGTKSGTVKVKNNDCSNGGGLSQLNVTVACSSTGRTITGEEDYLELFPNPAHDVMNIYFNAEKESKYTIKVYDAFGKEVLRKIAFSTAGMNQTEINVSTLPGGVYQLMIIGDGIKSTNGAAYKARFNVN